MDKQDHGDDRSARRHRQWQFGLLQLLLVPAGLALTMAFFIAWYPFSMMMLPILLGCLVTTVGLSILPGSRVRLGKSLVVSGLFYGAATVLAPGCIDLSEPARRSQCCNNLKQIQIALHNYHDRYGCFPPAYVPDKNGRPMHSWRVLLLPFLEEEALYARYRFDEPWNGPNNSKLANVQVSAYECPEQQAAGTPFITSYVAVVGETAAWPGAASARFGDFRDRGDRTIMVVEMADSGIHWMEPRDLGIAIMNMSVNPESGVGISSLHRDPGWRRQRLGANVAMADGHIDFLRTDMPEADVRTMVTAVDVRPPMPATKKER